MWQQTRYLLGSSGSVRHLGVTKDHNRGLLWAVASSVACMVAAAALNQWRYGTIPYHAPRYRGWDAQHYLAMALHPFGPAYAIHQAPYGWRILTPLLVHLLPVPPLPAFFVLNWIALCAVGPFLYAWLRHEGRGHGPALLAALAFYGLYWAVWFYLWDPLAVDGLAMASMAAGLYLIAVGADGWLAVLLPLAVLDKESSLFLLIPFAIRLAADRLPAGRSLARLALVAGPAALAFAVPRLAIPVDNHYSYFSLLRALPGLRHDAGHLLILHVAWTFTFAAVGPTIALAVVGLHQAIRRGVRPTASVVGAWCMGVPLLVAALMVSNPTRAVVYAFPAALWFVAVAASTLAARGIRLLAVGLVVADLVYNLSGPSRGGIAAGLATLMAAVGCVAVYYCLLRSHAENRLSHAAVSAREASM